MFFFSIQLFKKSKVERSLACSHRNDVKKSTDSITMSVIRTRITKLMGCKHPLLLPGMSWISTPELVASVCNAGGLGILATGPLNSDETRDCIKRIRKLAPDKPFGIGATLLMPGAKENAMVGIDEKVPLINVSLGKPDWIVEGAHSYGGKVLSTVTNAKHASAAVNSGVDALMVTGHEAAAHGGDVTSLVLIPVIASRFPEIPLVAAGGFANGRGLAAALALGADAIALGSRFATTEESPLATETKQAIANPSLDGGATESDTLYNKNFDGIPARVLSSPTAKQMSKPASIPVVIYRALKAAKEMNIPLWKVLGGLVSQWDKMYIVAQFGAATNSIQEATVKGNLKDGVQFVGQSQGLIYDIPTVDELVQRIMEDAEMVTKDSYVKFNRNDLAKKSSNEN